MLMKRDLTQNHQINLVGELKGNKIRNLLQVKCKIYQ